MILYPEVQRKAQAEIDQVVGNSRLPDFSDEAALPYVQAVLKEVLRWHPVTPLGLSLSIAGMMSLVIGLLLQRCHTGSQRAMSTMDITFLQAQLLLQTSGGSFASKPLCIGHNEF
jgi:cytochrome P450